MTVQHVLLLQVLDVPVGDLDALGVSRRCRARLSALAVSSRWRSESVPALRGGRWLIVTQEPGDVGLDRRLPGRYQVGWGEGGVYVRGGCSGAGDSDERDRVGGDPVPVALERYEVVGVELACLQPLD